MADKPSAAAAAGKGDSNGDVRSKPPTGSRPTYVSGGQMLDSPPLTARVSRFVDNAYNFFGLYLVSLFSMDPYAAAQNSQFNTRGPGRTSNAARTQWGSTTTTGGTGGGTGGAGYGSGGPRSGGAGSGGRRLGVVDDVRGPECGSCR